MKEYYTYAYLRKDGTPYYIGKGKRYRIDEENGKSANLPPKERRIFLKQNITEEEAFKHEIYMIAVFGRKDIGTGILRNRTNGGEGNSGRVVTSETKILLSEKLKKYYSENEIKQTTKDKLSKNWLGRTHSEEARKKMSDSNKGRKVSEETRKRMSDAQTGKKHTEEYKRKMEVSCAKKTYRITFNDGSIEMVKGLNRWCKDNGYSYVNVQYVKSGRYKYHKDIVNVEVIVSNLESVPTV